MTAPETALRRFALSCLLGVGLGIWYGFLRPLRPRRTALSDGLFLAGAAWAWLELGFRICGGDLRLGYAAGLPLGGLLWEVTLGRPLRPLFSGFWMLWGRLMGFVILPAKKF